MSVTEGKIAVLTAATRKAVQLAEIASDWNLDEVEIDGVMVPIHELEQDFCTAITATGTAEQDVIDAAVARQEARFAFDKARDVEGQRAAKRAFREADDTLDTAVIRLLASRAENLP